MSVRAQSIASPRLRALARRPVAEAAADTEAQERCELCHEVIPREHRHLLHVERRELLCCCRACSLLFDREGAGGGHLRPIPDRRLRLEGFALSDQTWEGLRIPVDIAFLLEDSGEGRVMAFYPGPMGATESQLELETWSELRAGNPVLASLRPDVEALLVDRTRGARRQWLVPIDECFALVGIIRTRWRGLSGGREVWSEIDGFFEGLDRRARPSGELTTATAATAAEGGVPCRT